MDIRQLTFTRFIAAFAVIVFHYGSDAFPFTDGLWHHASREGCLAVGYFFCLSGYILTHVYYSDSPLARKEFFLKRFARLYPLYFFGFIAALLSAMLVFHSAPKGISVILQLLGLHAWVPGMTLEINYPGWSLSVEVFFYALFPFIINFFHKRSDRAILLLTISLWLISAAIHMYMKTIPGEKKWAEFMLYNPLFHLNTFVMGSAGCMLVKRHMNRFSLTPLVTTLLLCGTSLALFFLLATDNPLLPYAHNGLFAPLFVLFIVALQFDKGITSGCFSMRPLIFLGNISYGMYILQHPVRIWYEQAVAELTTKPDANVMFYCYVAVLILVSSGTYFLIEQPMRKFIVSRTQSKKNQAVVQ